MPKKDSCIKPLYIMLWQKEVLLSSTGQFSIQNIGFTFLHAAEKNQIQSIQTADGNFPERFAPRYFSRKCFTLVKMKQ